MWQSILENKIKVLRKIKEY